MLMFISMSVHAQFNPQKETVKAIIPFPPGGGVDMAFKRFQKYADSQGITIVPIYRAGAEGLIGMTEGSEAKPDGLTLIFGTVTAAATHKIKNPDYNFEYITVLHSAIMAIATHPNNPIDNIDDLEKELNNPQTKKTFAYGSLSQKNIWEQYFQFAKIKTTPTLVPYKGTAPAVQDALGGHIDYVVVPYITLKSNIESGKLKLVAITSQNSWRELKVTNLSKKYSGWENEAGFLVSLPQHTNSNAISFWKNFVHTYLNDKNIQKEIVQEFSDLEPFGYDYANKKVLQAVKNEMQGKK